MGWFKRIKGRTGAEVEAQLSGKANKIAQKILVLQSRWAAELNAQALKIGKRNTIIILGALLMGLGCYCAWLVASVFF